MDLNFLTCLPNGSKKKRSHGDLSHSKNLKTSVQTCSKVHSSKCQKLHRSNKLEKGRGNDKLLCSTDNAIELCEKQKTNDCQADTAVNASNSKISSYSEKLLPFNKRKSRYYIIEDVDEHAKFTNEENICSGFEDEEFVKTKSLSSIYLTARIVPSNLEMY